MTRQPILTTDRLVLRAFDLADVADVHRLLDNPEMLGSTRNIPEPYEEGMAEAWIATHAGAFDQGTQAVYAVTLQGQGRLIGAVGLTIHRDDNRAELGYWVARSEWGQGYATEAAGAILRYGFERLGLRRIHADCLTRNPASARVLRKLGLAFEGRLRRHVLKRGMPEDLDLYGILRDEYRPGAAADSIQSNSVGD